MSAHTKPRNAMSLYGEARHKATARSLGYALTLGDAAAWNGFTIVAGARLAARERVALAFSALRTLSPSEAEATVAAALGESGAGMPVTPLEDAMSEAAFWADWADPAELDAYALACFNRMSPDRQAAFLAFIQRRAAA